MRGRAVTLVACVLAVAGCGGNDQVAKTVTRTVELGESSGRPAESSEKSGSEASVLKLGQTYRATAVSTTVYEVRNLHVSGGGTEALKSANERFVGFRVKTCLSQRSGLNWAPWRVVGADSGDYPALDVTPIPTEFPRPAYPQGSTEADIMPKGQCRMGWIVAPVSRSTTASRIVYQNRDGDRSEWSVK